MGRVDTEKWEQQEDGSHLPMGRGAQEAPERHRDPKPSEPESWIEGAGTDQPEPEQTEEQKATDEAAEEQAEAQAAAQTEEPVASAPDDVEDASSDPDLDATAGAIEYANEVGIDIHTVTGTGLNGRITKGDVEAAQAAQAA